MNTEASDFGNFNYATKITISPRKQRRKLMEKQRSNPMEVPHGVFISFVSTKYDVGKTMETCLWPA